MEIKMNIILMLAILNQMYGLGNNNNVTASTNKSSTIATSKTTTSSNVTNGTRYCVDLPIYGDNKTFCGIKTGWVPKLSNEIGISILVLTSALGCIGTAIGIYKTREFVGNVYDSKKNLDYLAVNTIACFSVSSKTAAMKIMIAFYGKLIWDAVDVIFDALIFYEIERGDIIDTNITRNSIVLYSILAFAILGALKIFLLIIWFQRPIGQLDSENKDDAHQILNIVFFVFTFLFEDGPELILEYFYIERFVTDQPPWYQLVKDVIMTLLAVYFVVDMLINGCKKFKAGSYKYFCLFFTPIAITVVTLLRAGAVIYQNVTGKLKRNCFDIQDGMLVQTPFAADCLREIDYLIIVALFTILVTLVIFVLNAKYLNLEQQFNPNKLDKDLKYHSKENRIYYEELGKEKLKYARMERKLIENTLKLRMLRKKHYDKYLKLWAEDDDNTLKRMEEVIEKNSKRIKDYGEIKRENFDTDYDYEYHKDVMERSKRKVQILKEFLVLILVDNDQIDLFQYFATLQQETAKREKHRINEICDSDRIEIHDEDRNDNKKLIEYNELGPRGINVKHDSDRIEIHDEDQNDNNKLIEHSELAHRINEDIHDSTIV